MALPVMDAVLAAVKGQLPVDDPVVLSVLDVISPEAVDSGEPLRAADVLVVVGVLKARLGPEPGSISDPTKFSM